MSDRLTGPSQDLVEHFTAAALFRTLFAATVVTHNSDGTVDVMPEDASSPLPECSGLPIRWGVHGGIVVPTDGGGIPASTRCAVGFTDGDPSQPFVSLFDCVTTAPGNFTFFPNDAPATTPSVARIGDIVTLGTNFSSQLSAIWTALDLGPPPLDFQTAEYPAGFAWAGRITTNVDQQGLPTPCPLKAGP